MSKSPVPVKKSPAPLIKKSALTTKVSPAPVLKKSPAAASRVSRRSVDTEEAPLKRIEKILQMAKSLRENSNHGSPAKGKPIETSYMKKRDQKYQKKGLSFGKKSPAKPSKSLFDSNPFTKKPSRFQKTLIATPSKFEIKVTKSPAKTLEKRATRAGVRGKLGKPEPVKKMPQKKVALKSKGIKKVAQAPLKSKLLKEKVQKAQAKPVQKMVKQAKLSLAKKKIVQKLVEKAKAKKEEKKVKEAKKPLKLLLGKRSASSRIQMKKPEIRNKRK